MCQQTRIWISTHPFYAWMELHGKNIGKIKKKKLALERMRKRERERERERGGGGLIPFYQLQKMLLCFKNVNRALTAQVIETPIMPINQFTKAVDSKIQINKCIWKYLENTIQLQKSYDYQTNYKQLNMVLEC